MRFMKTRSKNKAILIFKEKLRRKLSDDWSNKRKYGADEIEKSIMMHYPSQKEYVAYAVYMWSGKKSFDQFCNDNELTLNAKDIRTEIRQVLAPKVNKTSSSYGNVATSSAVYGGLGSCNTGGGSADGGGSDGGC